MRPPPASRPYIPPDRSSLPPWGGVFLGQADYYVVVPETMVTSY